MFNKAEALLELGETEQALAELAQAARLARPQLAEDHARALLKRGSTKEHHGDLSGALVDYRAARAIAPPGALADELEAIVSEVEAKAARVRRAVGGGIRPAPRPRRWILPLAGVALLIALMALASALAFARSRRVGAGPTTAAILDAPQATAPTQARASATAREQGAATPATPTAPATPTRADHPVVATPLPGPGGAVPPGWRVYQGRTLPFVLAYPPNWAVTEGPGAVRFATSDGASSMTIQSDGQRQPGKTIDELRDQRWRGATKQCTVVTQEQTSTRTFGGLTWAILRTRCEVNGRPYGYAIGIGLNDAVPWEYVLISPYTAFDSTNERVFAPMLDTLNVYGNPRTAGQFAPQRGAAWREDQ